jgi:hypothetical protein
LLSWVKQDMLTFPYRHDDSCHLQIYNRQDERQSHGETKKLNIHLSKPRENTRNIWATWFLMVISDDTEMSTYPVWPMTATFLLGKMWSKEFNSTVRDTCLSQGMNLYKVYFCVDQKFKITMKEGHDLLWDPMEKYKFFNSRCWRQGHISRLLGGYRRESHLNLQILQILCLLSCF